MMHIHLLLLVSVVAASYNLTAKTLKIKNESNKTFEVTLVPDNLLSMSPKEREIAVKSRYAILSPGSSANLNLSKISSIYVKSERDPEKGRYWFIYDQSSAEDVFDELRSNRKGGKLLIKKDGGTLEFRIGKESTKFAPRSSHLIS